MDNVVLEQMMLGIDLDEPSEQERKKQMNEEEIINLETTKERA